MKNNKNNINNNELLTIRDFIRYAISQFNQAQLFYGHGTENALDEAFALILSALHLPPDLNQNMLSSKLISTEKEHLFDLIHQRITKRIPVPYLTREAWFSGLPFYVDERVLIPRSPIAELIENHFEPWVAEEEVYSILDLCTGSGCIAIACAKQYPDSIIHASDISKDALAVAKINTERHGVTEQVELFQSDLFDNLPQQKYQIIVSNPPYVDAKDMATLPAEYHHEPRLALGAGEDGLDIVSRILKQASNYLADNGVLVVEVGNSEQALAETFPEVPFTWLEFQRGGGGVFILTAEQLRLFNAQ